MLTVSTVLLTLVAGPSAAASTTATVEQARFVHTIALTCELEAVDAAPVTAPRGLAGSANFTIAEMATEGAMVAVGDLLVRFDSGEVQQQAVQRETELVTARNDIEIRQLEAAAREAELRGKIAEAEAALTKATLDANVDPAVTSGSKLADARHAFERAKVELERQRQGLLAAEREAAADLAILRIKEETALAGLGQAERGLEAFAVLAPQDGLVVYAQDWNDRKYRVGDSVDNGTAVMTIQDLSKMRAVCDLDQADRHLAKLGQKVTVRVDARPASRFDGQVEWIAPFAESPSRGWWRQSDVRIFKTRVDLATTDQQLMKPGLSARADLIVHDQTGLTLPRAAVQFDAEGWFVQVAGARRPVEVIARNPTTVLLGAGVEPGQVVELAR